MKTLRIGTRGSELALWQANRTRELLEARGHSVELKIIKTTGDRRTDVSLATIGGKGLFIKEIEEALDAGTIDLAVHSLKDVPSIIPDRFVLAGFLERADPRDAWIHPDRKRLEDLPEGSVIGTSSPRRRAQLRHLYPQFKVVDIRGNVDTRIAKTREGLYAGTILAGAGLRRLGRIDEVTSFFDVEQMVPASGQGIVGIETLATRRDVIEIVGTIDDAPAHLAATCERGLLQRFDSVLDCYSAVGAHARAAGDSVRIDVFASDLDGKGAIRLSETGSRSNYAALLDSLEAKMREAGAVELFQSRTPVEG